MDFWRIQRLFCYFNRRKKKHDQQWNIGFTVFGTEPRRSILTNRGTGFSCLWLRTDSTVPVFHLFTHQTRKRVCILRNTQYTAGLWNLYFLHIKGTTFPFLLRLFLGHGSGETVTSTGLLWGGCYQCLSALLGKEVEGRPWRRGHKNTKLPEAGMPDISVA